MKMLIKYLHLTVWFLEYLDYYSNNLLCMNNDKLKRPRCLN